MSRKVLGIWGAGGLGREILELSKIINNRKKTWDAFVFIVDGAEATEVNGTPVLEYDDAKTKYSELEVVVGIGEPTVREKKYNQLSEDGIYTPSLIHPDVHIPDTTIVGRGVLIQYGCFISCNVNIGNYVYIQPHCNIGHDDKLADGCMIAGFGNIAGHVTIGKYTYLGLSVAVREGVTIGCNSIIGMGSVVHKDVPENMVSFGSPARSVSPNNDRKIFIH